MEATFYGDPIEAEVRACILTKYAEVLANKQVEELLPKSAKGFIPARAQAAIFEMIKLAKDLPSELGIQPDDDKDKGKIVIDKQFQLPTIWDVLVQDVQVLLKMHLIELNTDVTMPLPNKQEWQMGVDLDPELAIVILALQNQDKASKEDRVLP